MNLITTDPTIAAAVDAIAPTTTRYDRLGQLAAAIARGETTSAITLIDQATARTAAATGAPHGTRLFLVATTDPTAETYAYAKLAGAEAVVTLPAAADQLADLAAAGTR